MKCKSLLFKNDFKIAELLTKNILFSLFQRRPKNDEGNEQRRRRKYMCKSN